MSFPLRTVRSTLLWATLQQFRGDPITPEHAHHVQSLLRAVSED